MNTKAGIDYSNGMSNVDFKTGIHYGVISIHEVLQAWCDSSEAIYLGGIDDDDFSEPIRFELEDKEYIAEQAADDSDIFILRSPYYTYCKFCSPCAPGAGYLMDVADKETGIKAYCFGHDFFADGIAPYPVYSVNTNKLIES